MTALALDLGAGIGGWDLVLRQRGEEALGVELAPTVRAARSALGLVTIASDVYAFDGHACTGILRVCGSPSCQPFSKANPSPLLLEDPRAAFMAHALRIVLEARPATVCYENVPGTLTIFESMRPALEEAGYTVGVKVVNAADHGLPQTRERCLLVARLDGRPVAWPAPTHYGTVQLKRVPREVQAERALERGLVPWVTLAQALPHRRDLPAWAHVRPATTLVGSFRPEVLAAPGYRLPGGPSRQNVPDSVVADLSERLLLQGFPPEWRTRLATGTVQPKRGPRRPLSDLELGLMVGNAIPPTLARVALEAATR